MSFSASSGFSGLDADQHPRAGVTLAEDTDFETEQWDEPDFGERSTE